MNVRDKVSNDWCKKKLEGGGGGSADRNKVNVFSLEQIMWLRLSHGLPRNDDDDGDDDDDDDDDGDDDEK